MKLDIPYQSELPLRPRPICILGAGGIVNDAHLPAYRMAQFPVFGIWNRSRPRAEALASRFRIPHVFDTIEQMVAAAPDDAVYDIALMPPQYLDALEKLPDGAAVLIQKPMGDTWDMATAILETCRRKSLIAAINCQLRFAPFVSTARWLVENGYLGELCSLEVRVSVETPWQLFPNVIHHPRLEIVNHSIHYVDLLRSFLGNPRSVMAKTLRHPAKELSSTRSTLLLDYGETMHAVIHVNHDHAFGAKHQESFIKWEGTKGAIKARIGLLMNYPQGLPDCFEYCLPEQGCEPEWIVQALDGSWFPDAFVGTMASLMRFAEGSSSVLPTHVEDVIHTMATVEAAYRSNDRGGEPVQS